MHVLVLKAHPSLEIEVWNQIGSCSASSESGIFESDDEEEDNGLFQASQGSCHHDFSQAPTSFNNPGVPVPGSSMTFCTVALPLGMAW